MFDPMNAGSWIEILHRRAEEAPSEIAFRFLPEGRRELREWTYAEALRQALAWAGWLRDSGGGGQRALLLFPPGLDYVAAVLGCLAAGVVAVPAYPPLRSRSLPRLLALAADCRPHCVLGSEPALARLRVAASGAGELADALWMTAESLTVVRADDVPPAPAADSLALLQYTSGSTGEPKGVMVSHRNLLANSARIRKSFHMARRREVVSWLPPYHDMGLIGSILQPLFSGVPATLMAPAAFLQNPGRWLRAISGRPGVVSGAPDFAYRLCAQRAAAGSMSGLDLTGWEVAFSGAEPVRASTLDLFAEAFAGVGFDRQAFYPCYGLAEATLMVAGGDPGTGFRVTAAGNRTLVSCGRSLAGQEVEVCDSPSGRRLPEGVEGEIWVRGPSVAQGYWGKPEATASEFRSDGWLRTGDLGFLQDGELFPTGRLKDLIILRGRNLYPQDLERTAEAAHPALRAGASAAFSVEAAAGEELILVVEIEPGAAPQAASAAAAVRRGVVLEHETPVAEVAVVRAGEVPRTTSGKVRRSACREAWHAGTLQALARHRLAPDDGSDLQSQPAEELWPAGSLPAVVARVLRRPLDPGRPLVEQGLDSLGAVELQHAIESELGVALTVGEVLEADFGELSRRVASCPEGVPEPTPLLPEASAGEYAATATQIGLWLTAARASAGGNAGALNVAVAVTIEKGDLSRLRQVIHRLPARHEALRTTFRSSPKGLTARTDPGLSIDWSEESVDSEGALEERLASEAHRVFDLESGPLARARLFHRGAAAPVLLLVAHHLVCDLWSLGLLLGELGQPATRAEGSAFSSHVRRAAQVLAGPRGEELARFWEGRLAGAPRVLDLPTDHRRPPLQSFGGLARRARLGREIVAALHELARAESTTATAVLLATWQILLHRISGQDDFLIATPAAGRWATATATAVGCFVNLLPLRARFDVDPTTREHLGRSWRDLLGGLDRQDYPFSLIAQRLVPEGDPGRSPLVQAAFTDQSFPHQPSLTALALGEPGASLTAGPYSLVSRSIEVRGSQFDLHLFAGAVEGEVVLALQACSALFDGTTVRRLLNNFEVLLSGLVQEPGRRVSELPLLSSAEQAQILLEWNDTAAEQPRGLFHHLFERQAQASPDASAMICEGESWTYAELLRRAREIARELRAMAVGPDVPVGICAERSPELVAGLLGILFAGGAYVPLDPDHPRERLHDVVASSGLAAILIQRRLLGLLARPSVRHLLLDRDPAVPANLEDPGRVDDGAVEASLIYVLYTSGSTGRPKGAMNTHGAVGNRLLWMQASFGLTATDRVLQKTPLSFDVSVWELFWPLLAGACLVMARPGGHRDAAYLADLIEREGVTTVHFVPSMLEAFLEAVDRDRCPSLRRVLASGEALSPVLAERFFDRLGHAELYNLYGPTEAAVDVTFWRCTPGAGSVPLGRPIDNTALRVLDRRLLAVPIGAAGELMIGGAPPARGYLGRPDLTAERFVPDPYGDPGARLYRTGDLARWTAGGLLEYLGRIDQQVKIRGVRVEPGEVEATLAAHPAIREAAVVVGAGPRLIAYVAAMDLEVDGTALRSFLSERLPAAMVPSTFVLLAGRDGLPRTPNGKLDRRALPAPPPISGETPYAAPRTPVEEIVAEAWSEALGIRPVGIDDDYFALGGDSIRTLRVQALARRRGLHLAFADLYRFRTVRELAATARPDHSVEPETEPLSLLTAAERAPLPPTVEDAFPLARVLAGLAFESALEDDYEVYVTSLHLRARVDPVALQRAADLLVSRHPMLRSSFDLGSVGRPLQLVHRQVRVAIRFVDLSSLPSSVAAREVEEFLGRERRRRFDWERPPLLRLAVHSLADGTFHLSASEPFLDGWSVATMLTELLRFQLELSAQGDGQRKPEAPPAGSFASFVALELAALHSEEARRFWAERLAGAAPARWPRWPLAPRDRRSPAISRLEVPIPTELSHALERSAREIGTPLKSLLLAAHLKVLAVQMGVDDVLAGVLGSGRPETLDGDRILGLFLQPVPLRLRLGAATWADLARRAFDAEREILPHRRYPSAELRQQHGGEPLFDAVFNYTHFHAYLGLTSLPEIQVLGGTATDQTYFDLTVQFNLDHAGGGLRLALDFRTAKWSRAQIRAIGELYRQALARLAEAPHSRHDAVPLLSPAERHQILQEWNDTDTVWGRQGDLPLHALVAEQAARTPHAVAVSSVEGSWTYAELLHHSAVVARWLRRVPLSLEQPVAVCSERSLDLVAGLLGSLLAGLPFLPLDATDPEDRLAAVLEAAASGPHSPVLLTRRRWQGQRPAALAGLARRGVRELFLDEAEADAPALQETPPAVDPGALAYVLHTSGSTGRPKGAMNSHQGVVNRLLWMQRTFSLTPEDRVLQKTPVSFDVSVWELFWPLITGARLVLAPPEAHLDPAEIVSLIVDEGVTVAHFVPSLLRLFLDEPAAVTCRSLRRVIASGEALGTHLADRFHAALPDTELHNLYGPTEAAIDVAAWACAPGATTVPIGRPVANTRLYIVDRTGLPVSAGAPGELWIGGVQVGRGYLGRPDLTAERFVPDPFSRQPGARAYRTGDLARHLPEGEIDFLGRVDHQVKLRGVRVELGEVEAALASHPGVAAAAAGVAPAPDGHPRLVAWWVAGPAGSPSEESLREHVSSRLPRSMVPAAFVKLSSLPHTPSGKLDRQRLPSPEAATESRIAELLAQVAALSDEQAQAVLSAGQKS